jgi:hypothetical protein
MVRASLEQYQQADRSEIKVAALKNVAFFSVALKLLDDSEHIPDLVRDQVTAELTLIQAHQGWSSSPIFEASESKYRYLEDYSQYVPRGHYTRNEKFESFFKAMMWYGRMIFPLPRNEDWQIDEFLKRVARQALLITQALMDSSYHELWDRIYQPTEFFIERSDDLTPYDYLELMEQVYGETWKSVDSFADEEGLLTFIAKAMGLRDPKVESGIKWTEAARPDQFYKKGLKFMGQRFTPDAYMFQELVYPNVSHRFLPKGLDIMAVLGSETAEQILETEGDFDLPGYAMQLEKLQQEFSELTIEDWTKTLYWSWLYSLKPLLKDRYGCLECPSFMLSDAWAKKALNAALASWAELRHDTILYVKQSYTTRVLAPLQPKGYVEPYPEVYQRVADLASQMRESLAEQGLLLDEVETHLRRFEELLDQLKLISEKELRREALTEEEYGLISRIGYRLHKITQFSEALMGKIAGGGDAKMMFIADVHTDANTRRVLEEGVGYPFIIYVIAPIEGKLILTQGAVFSYYEFPWPMDDRLTDERWQEMLEAGEEPNLPAWTDAFIVNKGG